MALTGHLNDLSLSELIEFFCNQRKTGQLKVLYPQGHGYFFLQSGSVVDARIGILRGIDAVYYSLTLPSAKFEFSGAADSGERTINQPWTQVVLEGLRRLDEGIAPPLAFPDDYVDPDKEQESSSAVGESIEDLEQLRVPSFLSFMSRESLGRRKYFVASAAGIAVLMSVAALGVPAGWYGRKENTAAVITQPTSPAPEVAQPTAVVEEVPQPETTEAEDNTAALAAKRQRDREKNAAREERLAAHNQTTPGTASTQTASQPVAAAPATQSDRPGPKKITVTVTYDESGRVTQASGGDASAIRIARQKRFPAGKAGSATITIPVN